MLAAYHRAGNLCRKYSTTVSDCLVLSMYYTKDDDCALRITYERFFLVDSDWDLSADEWQLMSRCSKCGNQLYPTSARSAYIWAEMAYKKCLSGHMSPEGLRDKQAPNLLDQLAKRRPRLMYY